MAGWTSAVFGVVADLLAVKVELDLDPPVGHWTGAGGQVFSHSGHPDITAGSRSRERLPIWQFRPEVRQSLSHRRRRLLRPPVAHARQMRHLRARLLRCPLVLRQRSAGSLEVV